MKTSTVSPHADFGLLARFGKLPDLHATLRLEADVDQRVIAVDCDDVTLNDSPFDPFTVAKCFVEKLREALFSSGSFSHISMQSLFN